LLNTYDQTFRDYPRGVAQQGRSLAKWNLDNDLTVLVSTHNAPENYSKSIFETYQRRINELLLTPGTDFAITSLTSRTDERANESYSDFGFLILKQPVPLTTRQDDPPCFKNTLSEGDKSTLTFAFFTAATSHGIKSPGIESWMPCRYQSALKRVFINNSSHFEPIFLKSLFRLCIKKKLLP
jgi:hypothetical protein